jgi:hypothetical protein
MLCRAACFVIFTLVLNYPRSSDIREERWEFGARSAEMGSWGDGLGVYTEY